MVMVVVCGDAKVQKTGSQVTNYGPIEADKCGPDLYQSGTLHRLVLSPGSPMSLRYCLPNALMILHQAALTSYTS